MLSIVFCPKWAKGAQNGTKLTFSIIFQISIVIFARKCREMYIGVLSSHEMYVGVLSSQEMYIGVLGSHEMYIGVL